MEAAVRAAVELFGLTGDAVSLGVVLGLCAAVRAAVELGLLILVAHRAAPSYRSRLIWSGRWRNHTPADLECDEQIDVNVVNSETVPYQVERRRSCSRSRTTM